ncbi:MAG: ComF family protein [Cyclobacteriaceae bacterium]|nr:ComF family protein [Cyclobacteriaceae bacterium]
MNLAELFNDFITLIYPRYCLACTNGLIKGEEILCSRCIHELPRTNFHLIQENSVFRRLYGRLPIHSGTAFLHFHKKGIVQRLMHEFKYRNRPDIGRVLGSVYAWDLEKSGFSGYFEAILPVPLHPDKQKKRGYNQSDEFAKGLGERLQKPVLSNVLLRTKPTETQTRKTKLKRWQNVEDVFTVKDAEQVSGKKLLLVDDVITTGATLEACGKVLLEVGCSQLSVAGIAYAAE